MHIRYLTNAGGVKDIIAKQDKYDMFDKKQKDFIDGGKVVKINETSETIIVQNTTDTSGGGASNETVPSGNQTVPDIPSGSGNETAPSGNESAGNETYPHGGKSGSIDNYTYVDYYEWIDSFDWSSCGVPVRKSCGGCGSGYGGEMSCGHCYQSQCKRREIQRCNNTVPVVPPANETNNTIPTPPVPPSGNVTPPVVNITIVQNCSFFKVCRSRPKCEANDYSWWKQYNYAADDAASSSDSSDEAEMDDHSSMSSCGCSKCGCEKKIKIRKRICNATADADFNSTEFLCNQTYYATCDCVVFKNCTNETIIVPPIVPVPPVPSGDQPCNYTCQDILLYIRDLHIALANLTSVVQAQQDDIDMLIGKYQDLYAQVQNQSSSGSGGSSCDCAAIQAQVASLDTDVQTLYDSVANLTADATEATLATIRDNGVRFGDNWWFGAQGDYLFAIDVAETSYYRFDSGVNKTL